MRREPIKVPNADRDLSGTEVRAIRRGRRAALEELRYLESFGLAKIMREGRALGLRMSEQNRAIVRRST